MIPHIVATIFEQRQHKEVLRSGASTCYMDKAKPPDCILCMRQHSSSPSNPGAADEAWYMAETRPTQWVTLHYI